MIGGKVILLLTTLAVHQATALVTNDDLQNIKCTIFDLIDTYQGEEHQGHPLLAKIVRLAFHDCIGGCDGVVDLSIHGTEGLDVPLNQLQGIYTAYFASKMSRADFWAAAGTMAILKGSLNAGVRLPPLKFYSGRVDGNGVIMSVPNPHGGFQHVVNFFSQTFGLNAVDSIALMGAHVLGRASSANLGFNGSWAPRSGHFDNSYYIQQLRADGWQQVTNAFGMTQWQQIGANADSNLLMLNVDMSLSKDIGAPDLNSGQATCTASTACAAQAYPITGINGVATAAQLMALYATNNGRWLDDFAAAYNKLIAAAPAGSLLTEVVYANDTACCCAVPCPAAAGPTDPSGSADFPLGARPQSPPPRDNNSRDVMPRGTPPPADSAAQSPRTTPPAGSFPPPPEGALPSPPRQNVSTCRPRYLFLAGGLAPPTVQNRPAQPQPQRSLPLGAALGAAAGGALLASAAVLLRLRQLSRRRAGAGKCLDEEFPHVVAQVVMLTTPPPAGPATAPPALPAAVPLPAELVTPTLPAAVLVEVRPSAPDMPPAAATAVY